MGSPRTKRKDAAAALLAWWPIATLRATWSDTAGHYSSKHRAAGICPPEPLLLALLARGPLRTVTRGLRLPLGTQPGRFPFGGWRPLIVRIREGLIRPPGALPCPCTSLGWRPASLHAHGLGMRQPLRQGRLRGLPFTVVLQRNVAR